MTLSEVLYVPLLAINLFSIPRASSNGEKCIFLEHNDVVFIKNLGPDGT